MTGLVLGGFEGPGGWSTGLRIAGWTGDDLGVEIDPAACATATAAGHRRILGDVARFPVELFAGLIDGVTMSPPCTTFSTAGQGAGRELLAVLATAMTRTIRGQKVLAATRRECARILRRVAAVKMPKATRRERAEWAWRQAVLSVLVVQPARWVLAIRPRWVALEQVPAVAPLWRHLAALLRELGYAAWSGVLSAEEYGVPQTRKRAILIARNDGVPVGPPTPTHQPYRAGREHAVEPDLFGDPLPPPVSMAEALDWHDAGTLRTGNNTTIVGRPYERAVDAPAPTLDTRVGGKWRVAMRSNYGTGGDAQNRGERTADELAATVTGKVGRNMWIRQTERQVNGGDRPVEAPSLTITASLDNGNMRRHMAPAGATSTMVDPRPVTDPGHTITGKATAAWVSGEETRRVTVQEAAILQSFPPDYPWQGNSTDQYRQVGDAVPPLLAYAILRPLIQPNAKERAA